MLRFIRGFLFNTGLSFISYSVSNNNYPFNYNSEEECEINFVSTRSVNISRQLDKYMNEKQLFLNPDLNMEMIAREIGTNRTYLSAVISSSKEGFFIYVNGMRLKYFMSLIKKDKELLLDDAIYLSGIKNRKAFFNVVRRLGTPEDINYLKKRYICKSIKK
jgi:hypothetical protein